MGLSDTAELRDEQGVVEPDDPGFEPHEVTFRDGKAVPFTVHDLASAEWAVRKLAGLRARYEECKALRDVEVDRIDAWLAGEKDALDRAEEFFGGLLESWHRAQLDGDERRKTIKLPSGALRARKSPDRVEVADPDGFVCAHGFDSEFVRVTATPDLAAVKKAVLGDGEVIDGVTVIPGDVRFTIETAPPVVPEPEAAF